jgi:hypothetical protein
LKFFAVFYEGEQGEFHGERRFAANRGQSKQHERDFQMIGDKS